jgi:hypothetical protein
VGGVATPPHARRRARALLLVTALAAGGVPALRPLYRVLDLGAAALARALGLRYGRRVRLRGPAATRAGFLDAVARLAADPGIAAVDVVVNLHGLPGRLTFADGAVDVAELAAPLRAAGRGKLRLVYSSACHGVTHGEALLRGGFAAAIGAARINATGGTELGLFALLWACGASAGRALALADPPLLRRPTDVVAGALLRALGEPGAVDSRKALHGDGRVRIDAPHGAE